MPHLSFFLAPRQTYDVDGQGNVAHGFFVRRCVAERGWRMARGLLYCIVCTQGIAWSDHHRMHIMSHYWHLLAISLSLFHIFLVGMIPSFLWESTPKGLPFSQYNSAIVKVRHVMLTNVALEAVRMQSEGISGPLLGSINVRGL
jgi:hypothetical protein